MAQGMSVEGTGSVSWTCTADYGLEIEVCMHAYYVPKSAARLLSPQPLFNKKTGIFGKFSGDEDSFSIYLNENSAISTSYNAHSGLPIANAYCGTKVQPSVNLTILDEENQNLTAGQKLLLEWHYKFGHLNFNSLQNALRNVLFVAKRLGPAVKIDAPKCSVCEFAKANCRPRKSERQTKIPERDGSLKAGHIRPGARVSVDHFE
jgi:hypothetical protein